MKQVTFLVLICVCFLLPESAQKTELRVIGGRDAVPGEYPFTVRLESHYKLIYAHKNRTIKEGICSGAALSSTWTLTAKHCLKNRFSYTKKMRNYTLEYKFMIRYGNPHMKPSENHNLSAVLKAKILKKKMYPHGDDIALLNNEPISLNIYAQISAIDYIALYGHEVNLMGYGLMRASQTAYDYKVTLELDKPLQVMKAMLRSCDDIRDASMSLCAVPACGSAQSAYQGDSGGPVVHASGVIGVNAAGLPYWEGDSERTKLFAKPNTLIVTPVSPYLDWIHSHVAGDIYKTQ